MRLRTIGLIATLALGLSAAPLPVEAQQAQSPTRATDPRQARQPSAQGVVDVDPARRRAVGTAQMKAQGISIVEHGGHAVTLYGTARAELVRKLTEWGGKPTHCDGS